MPAEAAHRAGVIRRRARLGSTTPEADQHQCRQGNRAESQLQPLLAALPIREKSNERNPQPSQTQQRTSRQWGGIRTPVGVASGSECAVTVVGHYPVHQPPFRPGRIGEHDDVTRLHLGRGDWCGHDNIAGLNPRRHRAGHHHVWMPTEEDRQQRQSHQAAEDNRCGAGCQLHHRGCRSNRDGTRRPTQLLCASHVNVVISCRASMVLSVASTPLPAKVMVNL